MSTEEWQRERDEARGSVSRARLQELMEQQGVKPIANIDDLSGDFWPEDESTDDFLEWLRNIREGDISRSIPE